MATNYPGSLDNFTNPTSTNTLDSPSHSLQHSNLNDAVEAIETKLGAGAATPGTATAYYPLVSGTAGETSWTRLTAAGITAGSASAGQVLTASTGGTTTWTTPTTPGLVQVVATSVAVGSGSGSVDANGAVTFTGASSVSLNGCFTSAYDNYRIVYDFTGSTGTNNNLRLRTSSDDTTSNYMRQYLYTASTTVAGGRSNSQTTWLLGDHNGTKRTNAVIDLFSPNLAQVTGGQHYSAMYYDSSTENAWLQNGLGHNSSTQFTGFTIYPSSGTITGTARVYGYKN